MTSFLVEFFFGCAFIVIGVLIGMNIEKRKHQAEKIPERRRQVCYYSNGQIWQLGRHMEKGMLVSLTPGSELLSVQRDVHFFVVDPMTGVRVWLIYG